MVDTQYICVHCHYYQPPRGNPFNPNRELEEPAAAPFKNWNERITTQCYTPNAEIGNFDSISFNLGKSLARWLAKNAPDTYHRILQADANNIAKHGMGNAIAQGMHHTVLPLSRYEDKVTQVAWGKAVFSYRFGRPTQGMWLPEMAVDTETLQVLAEQDIRWTILTESQVEGKGQGAGPYWANLPNGKRIKVFVRDEQLSNDIAFNLGYFGGAGRWARGVLVPRKRDAGPLTLIATDGETFGHHWPSEEQFLHWLLTYEALASGYEVITLARYAQMVEPQGEITIRENTSWSCNHGLARWATGCPCTPGDASWKGAVRRALDAIRFEMDEIYHGFVHGIDGADPYKLRDAYIDVALGKTPRDRFVASQGINLNADRSERLMKLVEAQYYRQRMYSSCTFYFPELDALTTQYGIANGAYAVKLTRDATGDDLTSLFHKDLSIATSRDEQTGETVTGAQIYDNMLEDIEQ